jgi:hypothetical protein
MTYYKAKKIEVGLYKYRGYAIEEMKQRVNHPYIMWNVSEIIGDNVFNTYDCEDATNTLKEAKRLIDYYIKEKITNK